MTRAAVITPAQADVLAELITHGGTNRQIARRLGISEQTVKSHVRALLAAAKVPDRTALAVAVLRGDVRPAVRRRDRWNDTTRRTA